MLRILIADDHAIVREGLKRVIEDAPDLQVTDEAEDGEQALELAERNEYDAIVLDISMPRKDGLDTLKQLKVRHPSVPVLILSVHPEEQYALRVLKSGAAGYLTKKSAPMELIQAIRRISEGKKYVTASLAERLAEHLDHDFQVLPHESLSDREFQVLCLVAAGKTPSQIAGELALSVKTVSTYRARILEKMGLKNTAELMQYALRAKLVE